MTELNPLNTELTTADIAGRTRTLEPLPTRDGVTREIEPEATDSPSAFVSNATDLPDTRTTAGSLVPGSSTTPLFSDSDIGDLRSRWSNLQTEFVDEPRHSVEAADQLVATVMQRLAEGFAKERASLESKWDSGETASTEDLRMALQRYRAFFNRLLNAA